MNKRAYGLNLAFVFIITAAFLFAMPVIPGTVFGADETKTEQKQKGKKTKKSTGQTEVLPGGSSTSTSSATMSQGTSSGAPAADTTSTDQTKKETKKKQKGKTKDTNPD
jgi:hypothetical protein